MKTMERISTVNMRLEKMYQSLNADLFGGQLVTPAITIQSTPSVYGRVSCQKIWKSDDLETYELNIGAGTLNRPIENVVTTMVHEMVHIYHLQNDIQDTSRGGTYHNKKFKEKAESVGLVIGHDARYGWAITAPGESLIAYVKVHNWKDILLHRDELVTVGGKSGSNGGSGARKPSSTRKYICPRCGASVRATRAIKIICGDCFEKDNNFHDFMITGDK